MQAPHASTEPPAYVSEDHLDAIASVLDAVRADPWSTRPGISRASGLGRNVVAKRTRQLLRLGLLQESPEGTSTGGRAARTLGLRSDAGLLLVAELGATGMAVGIADLSGTVLSEVRLPSDITDGPKTVLPRVAELFDAARARHPGAVWGVGVALPGPVEFTTGRPVAPPIMPGWDDFDVRGYFAERFNAPTWIDNDVNVMALGELRGGLALGHSDVIYVKIGTGIGAGLISRGQLHRGAQGCAGDIGHITTDPHSTIVCRCGQLGCLEALAGGTAIARRGAEAAAEGRSDYLAPLAAAGHRITSVEVGAGALRGDRAMTEIVTDSARLVGEALAGLVNFFNPSLILLGGGVSEIGDVYLAAVRQMVLRRSLPLATRALQIERSPLASAAGLRGAAFMVLDELLSKQRLGLWINGGSPEGQPHLSSS